MKIFLRLFFLYMFFTWRLQCQRFSTKVCGTFSIGSNPISLPEQTFDCNPNYGHKVKLKYVGAYQVTEVNCQGEIYKVTIFALLVQWIECLTTDQMIRVRLLCGVQYWGMFVMVASGSLKPKVLVRIRVPQQNMRLQLNWIRALVYEARGWGFESLQAYKLCRVSITVIMRACQARYGSSILLPCST